ncbi:LysR substrate-binding domain-containing protein [Methylovirgula sp. HY1]|uniref:LysR substrate-binding domain-containing protein n=1 Tax=Methylovirgula sp. HY1 TaxID=2822761 RepID=UPI001C5BE7F8|nr:LysR substrate-binding domain-containing protein [Methylovirgula sp. HY1]QXX73634.1 Hydrogen peroxide-inducible genes activator [Methylovirgula sp. HY1]
MNLRDLRYITALADFGHFGKAAEACHVSQPTLSGQILKLEDELGVPLFERSGRALRPTAAGAEILIHARRAIAAADEIVAIGKASRDPLAGPLHLGIIPTLCPYLMPFVFPRLTKDLPSMPLVLHEDLTERLIEGVSAGTLDAAIIASAPMSPALTSEILFDEAFWLALPANHKLAKKKTIATADIDPQTLLLLTDGHCLRDQALTLCGAPDLANGVSADMRAASLETLLQMAAAGYGMTLVPALALAQQKPLPKNLMIRKLKDPAMKRQIRLISRAKYPRGKALEALGRLVKEAGERCPEDEITTYPA